MPHVTSVAGMGMMLGIELDIDVKPVVTALMENGLLVLTAKHKMRLLPPSEYCTDRAGKRAFHFEKHACGTLISNINRV